MKKGWPFKEKEGQDLTPFSRSKVTKKSRAKGGEGLEIGEEVGGLGKKEREVV